MHEYTTLVFIPSQRPFDLFNPERKHAVKLYVKRVFVTDDCAELVPQWLRFLRGLVDSEDLPLNISREMLQNNPLLARMRTAIVRRVLGELAKKAEAEPESYAAFWENFGPVLKEGLYEDADNRDEILKLARFHSTAGEGLVGLDDYVERMKEGQEAIYYIAGEELEAVRRSPQLEGFRARGIEVLLMTDPVDEFWIPAAGTHADKPFKSATRAGADLADIAAGSDADTGEEAVDQGRIDSVIAMFKLALKDEIKDVRVSDRLTDSAACLVADEGDLDINLERLLKQHGQIDAGFKRILEINPRHALIRSLAARRRRRQGRHLRPARRHGVAGARSGVLLFVRKPVNGAVFRIELSPHHGGREAARPAPPSRGFACRRPWRAGWRTAERSSPAARSGLTRLQHHSLLRMTYCRMPPWR